MINLKNNFFRTMLANTAFITTLIVSSINGADTFKDEDIYQIDQIVSKNQWTAADQPDMGSLMQFLKSGETLYRELNKIVLLFEQLQANVASQQDTKVDALEKMAQTYEQVTSQQITSQQASIHTVEQIQAQFAKLLDSTAEELEESYLEGFKVEEEIQMAVKTVKSVRDLVGTFGKAKISQEQAECSKALQAKFEAARLRVQKRLASLVRVGEGASQPSSTSKPSIPKGLDLWRTMSRKELRPVSTGATSSTVPAATVTTSQSSTQQTTLQKGKEPVQSQSEEVMSLLKSEFVAMLSKHHFSSETIPGTNEKKVRTLDKKIEKLSSTEKNKLLLEMAKQLGIK